MSVWATSKSDNLRRLYRAAKRETLSVKYKGLSIADLLDTTIEDALPILENIPQIKQKLQTLLDVGLGYIKIGQSSTTLSGGEARNFVG